MKTPEKFEDIWQQFVIDPLKSISVANGYENDLCWLDGWLLYYADDIGRGRNNLFWPAIGARPGVEEIEMQPRGGRHEAYKAQNIRSFVIEVGVDGINSRDTLTQRLESVVRDIKKAIGTVNTSNITLTRVNFNIPEDTLDYAFIVVEGGIKYNETWD